MYVSSTKPSPKTHRFFYINGKLEFGYFTDTETDINKILEKFFIDKDFIFMKNVWGEEWENLKLIKFDVDKNEVHLQNQKGKSLVGAEKLQNNVERKNKEKKVYVVKRNVYNRSSAKAKDSKKSRKSLV